MPVLEEIFIKTEKQKQIYEKLDQLENTFKERGAEVDKEGSFPFENINDLKKIGYPGLTVPKEYGGGDISLYDLVLFQEKLAQADGSTALGLGWSLGVMMDLNERRPWKEEVFAEVCRNVVKTGALLNRAATEPKTGSPTRGGKPETTAVKKDGAWLITGRKTFTTMSPVLNYFLVAATVDGSDEVGEFLIPRDTDGVMIVETWDSVAMRGSGSHDLILNDAAVPEDYLVEENRNKRKVKASGWLLHIPACYLGIALAARNEALRFATSYSPNSITGTISEIPNVKRQIGEIELKLSQARQLLYAAAQKWDEDPEKRDRMAPQLQVAKYIATNSAVDIVDQAMRIVGARSLSQSSPMQRYYRDVRAGLHNPPMDDMVIASLADAAIQSFK
ncbi:acyl-CoA dehydrogenase [Pueribacillus theae]|uniref:Acyl-CoA dehydrogenase n=1 Tax=Pueribacillus theae TaxID=2171751 RepID=A0A2U1JZX0_9BACI|nr:acyl-CoA dehydrogenase family protein [Pueribacillus theae]PWA10682.1 acyl-CoA dehydrogenase [Pueribacillus theae]